MVTVKGNLRNIIVDVPREEDLYRLEALRQARKKQLVINMLTVFGDDSADEKQQRVFSVAGVMGNQEEWDALELLWLDRTGGKPFHSADCESGRGEYKSMSREERLRLYADLVKIIAASKLMSYTVVIDLQAFYDFMPNAVDYTPYFICFRLVVLRFAQITSVHIPREKVEFIFDLDSKTRAGAASLYEYMMKKHKWKRREYMADIIGFACRKTVGIQVADIIAREAMKHYDNFFAAHLVSEHHRKLPVRQSMKLLLSSERHWFKHLDGAYFEQEKRNSELSRESDPFKANDYLAWLSENRRNDTLSNKFAFLSQSEEK